jgi:hypothetical protein
MDYQVVIVHDAGHQRGDQRLAGGSVERRRRGVEHHRCQDLPGPDHTRERQDRQRQAGRQGDGLRDLEQPSAIDPVGVGAAEWRQEDQCNRL